MAGSSPFTAADLKDFDKAYDKSLEERAINSRGAFKKAFPIRRLPDLTVEEYVIGLKSPTFCDYVEAKTRYWE